MTENNWFSINFINAMDSPALVIYPERVRKNIDTAIRMIGDKSRLRPHIKTSKSPDAVSLLLESGISKFKCATIAEAELLGMLKAPDVLLAYQPNVAKLHRFVQLMDKYPHTHYSCLIDNPVSATIISQAANERQINVYLDIDLGMHRTGILPEMAMALFRFCKTLENIHILGLHGYDGHIRDLELEIRELKCNAAFEKIEMLENEIKSMGYFLKPSVIGGSPAFSIHSKRKTVECSPGTFIYWDKGYGDICKEQSFIPAALVISRVVSKPSGCITTDLGHKSIAAENEINKRVFFINHPELQAVSQSEEHLVLKGEDLDKINIGDILYGLPMHICPTVALYEKAFTIENGKINGIWLNTARDRQINI